MYIDYSFYVKNTKNQTTGFVLKFPSPALNIKANNAHISIAKLGFINATDKNITNKLSLVDVQTSIPTSSCVKLFEGTAEPRSSAYSELIMFDTIQYTTADTFQAYQYNGYSTHKVLCANPLSNTYNLKFYGLDNLGRPTIIDFQTENVEIVAITLKVELVEEDIF
jgi:hypothetical protein